MHRGSETYEQLMEGTARTKLVAVAVSLGIVGVAVHQFGIDIGFRFTRLFLVRTSRQQ
mgnify:CR=1 FL=1